MTDHLPAPFGHLADVLAGDPDAPDEVFTDDVELVDHTSGEVVTGLDEVRETWAEFAGRRAIATVDEVLADETRAAVRYTIRFRADAHQYAQQGTAWVTLDGDRISSWDAVWVEATSDLAPWDGD